MTGKRPIIKGSFGGHLDELVKHFPHDDQAQPPPPADKRDLQDKRDIHARLFEQAWRLEGERD